MISNRIKELRDSLDMSQTEFGKKAGMSRDAVNNAEHNRAKISETTIIAICSAYNVSREWLETGEGDMFNASSADYLNKLASQHGLGPGGKALLKVATQVIAELPEDQASALLDRLIVAMQDAVADRDAEGVEKPSDAASPASSTSVS